MTADNGSVLTVSAEAGVQGTWPERAVAPGEAAVFFAGWLVDRDRLAEELGVDQDTPLSDAELVLAAYRRWSASAFVRLRGGFAVVVWDERSRAARAVRDQLGVHPLFRAEVGNSHLFATSIDALVRDPRVPRQPDRSALLGMLAPSMPIHDETPYAAIRRIPQGHLLELGEAGSRVYRYWDPAPPGEAVRWVLDDEIERFDDLVAQAVRRCLAHGGPAIYLSGGLDSVSVAAYAADLSNSPPLALSLAFPRGDANEEVVQRSVAQTLGLPQVMLPLGEAAGPAGVLQEALDLAVSWPVPLQGPWLPAYLRLNEEAVARGCRTILTGGGGDEWLTVNPYWGADLMRRLRFAELVRFSLVYRRSFRLGTRHIFRNLWLYGLRELLLEGGQALVPRLVAAARLKHRLDELPAWIASDPAARELLRYRLSVPAPSSSIRSAYLREMRSALDHALMDLVMEEHYEGASRYDLRFVQPYWDADLVEFLYRLRPEVLHQGGRAKGLVRESLDRRFPDCGFGQQKKVAATNVFMAVIDSEAATARRRLGPIHALTSLGVLDPARIENALDGMLAGKTRLSAHRIWDILGLEAWARAHL